LDKTTEALSNRIIFIEKLIKAWEGKLDTITNDNHTIYYKGILVGSIDTAKEEVNWLKEIRLKSEIKKK